MKKIRKNITALIITLGIIIKRVHNPLLAQPRLGQSNIQGILAAMSHKLKATFIRGTEISGQQPQGLVSAAGATFGSVELGITQNAYFILRYTFCIYESLEGFKIKLLKKMKS